MRRSSSAFVVWPVLVLTLVGSLGACGDDDPVPIEDIPPDKRLVDLGAGELAGVCEWGAGIAANLLPAGTSCGSIPIMYSGCMEVPPACPATLAEWMACVPRLLGRFRDDPCTLLDLAFSPEDFAQFIEQTPSCQGLGPCGTAMRDPFDWDAGFTIDPSVLPPSEPPPPPPSVARADFPRAYADAVCPALDTCCDDPTTQAARQAGCAALVGMIEARSSELSSIPNVIYDGEAAYACVEYVTRSVAACQAFDPTLDCGDVLRGTLELGAACGHDAECAPVRQMEVHCLPDAAGVARCTVFNLDGPQGLPASRGEACAQSCLGASRNFSWCTSLPHDASSSQDGCYRRDDLYCAESRTCEELPQIGEPCAPGRSCRSHHYCDASGVCAYLKPVGEACSAHEECSDPENPTAACDASGTCVVARPDGASCLPTAPCVPGATCIAGRCELWGALSELCRGEFRMVPQ